MIIITINNRNDYENYVYRPILLDLVFFIRFLVLELRTTIITLYFSDEASNGVKQFANALTYISV